MSDSRALVSLSLTKPYVARFCRAIVARGPRFGRMLYFGRVTSGPSCRPISGSRRSRFDNLTILLATGEAERSGYCRGSVAVRIGLSAAVRWPSRESGSGMLNSLRPIARPSRPHGPKTVTCTSMGF